MKNFSIFLSLIFFLLSRNTLLANTEKADSLSQEIKETIVRSKDFIFSKEGANFLAFVLSSGFLIYLPKHLSKCQGISTSPKNFIDKIIRYPHKGFFDKTSWRSHFYYEIMTLLAGYIWTKTSKPYLAILKKN